MTKDKGTKQGSFIQELRDSRPGGPERRKVYGGDPIAVVKEDTAAPKTDLSKVSSAKAEKESKKKQPKPTADTPKTLHGTIDVGQIKSDLISELRSSRKRS